MAISPCSARSFSSSNTCETSPRSRTVMMWPFSVVAVSFKYYPRCWSAYSAKYASRATSDSGAYTPKTPHSSRGPSRSSSATRVMRSGERAPAQPEGTNGPGRSRECRRDRALVGGAQLADGDRQRALDVEHRAAHRPDHPRPGHRFDDRGRSRDHHAARALAEERLRNRLQPV